MDNSIPGIYIEEGAGVVVLFWLAYVLLFLFLRHLIRKRGVSRWILLEGVFLCLLADRFLALYNGECWRLTMEWDFFLLVPAESGGDRELLCLCGLRSYGMYRTPEPFCPSHTDRHMSA